MLGYDTVLSKPLLRGHKSSWKRTHISNGQLTASANRDLGWKGKQENVNGKWAKLRPAGPKVRRE